MVHGGAWWCMVVHGGALEQGLFVGWGVSFKERLHFDQPFENIELYNMLSRQC